MLAFAMAAWGGGGGGIGEIPVLSQGEEAALVDRLEPDRATVVFFYRPDQTLEVGFVEGLCGPILREDRAAVRLVQLASIDDPAARQHGVDKTPLALVYNRRRELVGQGAAVDEIRSLLEKAVRTPRIQWVDVDDPKAAAVYGKAPKRMANILKTMSLRPELMREMGDLVLKAHFQPGFLDCKTKETIASYVSALNACRYGLGSHGNFLQLQGGDEKLADALARDDLESDALAPKEKALLAYVRKLTLEPARVRDADVEALRQAGWTDEQIFEASFETALFAFFNRMADAYGLDYPDSGYFPPEERQKKGQSEVANPE